MARGVGGTSPVNIAHYLSGIDFPCQKADLMAHAEHNGAAEDALDMLQNMPDDEYNNMADVMKGYGEAHGAPGEAAHGNGHGSRSGSQSHAKSSARSGGRAKKADEDEGEEQEPHGQEAGSGSGSQHARAGQQSHKNR